MTSTTAADREAMTQVEPLTRHLTPIIVANATDLELELCKHIIMACQIKAKAKQLAPYAQLWADLSVTPKWAGVRAVNPTLLGQLIDRVIKAAKVKQAHASIEDKDRALIKKLRGGPNVVGVQFPLPPGPPLLPHTGPSSLPRVPVPPPSITRADVPLRPKTTQTARKPRTGLCICTTCGYFKADVRNHGRTCKVPPERRLPRVWRSDQLRNVSHLCVLC